MRQPNYQLMNEFATWMAMPKRLKASLQLPTSTKAFAEFKGVSERTLYRWKKDPSFIKMVEQRKLEQVAQVPNSAVAKVGPPRPINDARALRNRNLDGTDPATEADDPVYSQGLDAAEVQYLKVKDTLARMAADGNQGAMDLYLKHYGKQFLELEREDANPFVDLTDGQLVDQILESIGEERVAEWIAGRVQDG